jgi:hypothetical protein
LILEITNPLIGIFHGTMLSIGIFLGYLGLFAIGKVSGKVIWKIYSIKNNDKIVVEFLSYSYVNKRNLFIS